MAGDADSMGANPQARATLVRLLQSGQINRGHSYMKWYDDAKYWKYF